MEGTSINLADLVTKSIQIIIVLISAIWAYFRFRKENPLHPRIEFDLNCKFFGPQRNFYVVSFVFNLTNKGNIEFRTSEIRLRVLGIKYNDVISEFKGHEPFVNFPEPLFRKVNIVPTTKPYYFVRPGVNQSFHLATRVPEEIRFIIVRATFKYKSKEGIHEAEKVFEVKA